MSESTSSETPSDSLDVVIRQAAEDEHIKTIVEWMFERDLKSEPVASIFYQVTGRHLIDFYDLYNEDHHKQVYDQCEINMLEAKLQYVEA